MIAAAPIPAPEHDVASETRRYCDILRTFAEKAIKARYRGSALGIFWSLSNPIFMTLVYSAIFGTTFAAYYGHSILNYVLACFTALAVVNFFSQTTTQALQSIVANGSLINKIRMPKTVFPLSMVGANTFQFAVAVFPVMAIVTLITSRDVLNVLALVVPCVALLLVSAGVSLIVSALFVFFRDLPHLYDLVVFVVWITSPVFYPASVVPAGVRIFLHLNPIALIISSVRQIVLSGDLPDMRSAGLSLLAGVVCAAVGLSFFRFVQRDFMDLL